MAVTGTFRVLGSKSRSLASLKNRWWSSPFSSAAVAAAAEPESTCLKDYADYRRSLYGQITHKALLVDAVGTLVIPSQPMAQIYREIGEKYGVKYSQDEILYRYRRAYGQPWGKSRLSAAQRSWPSGSVMYSRNVEGPGLQSCQK